MSGGPAHSVGRNVQIPAFVNLYACEIGDETRLGYTPDTFPIAGNLDEEFLSLPMLPELTKKQIEICRSLRWRSCWRGSDGLARFF